MTERQSLPEPYKTEAIQKGWENYEGDLKMDLDRSIDDLKEGIHTKRRDLKEKLDLLDCLLAEADSNGVEVLDAKVWIRDNKAGVMERALRNQTRHMALQMSSEKQISEPEMEEFEDLLAAARGYGVSHAVLQEQQEFVSNLIEDAKKTQERYEARMASLKSITSRIGKLISVVLGKKEKPTENPA